MRVPWWGGHRVTPLYPHIFDIYVAWEGRHGVGDTVNPSSDSNSSPPEGDDDGDETATFTDVQVGEVSSNSPRYKHLRWPDGTVTGLPVVLPDSPRTSCLSCYEPMELGETKCSECGHVHSKRRGACRGCGASVGSYHDWPCLSAECPRCRREGCCDGHTMYGCDEYAARRATVIEEPENGGESRRDTQ